MGFSSGLATRISRLEGDAASGRALARDAHFRAFAEAMFADETARDAVIAFHNHMRRHHPERRPEEVIRDRRVFALYEGVLAHARRLGVEHHLRARTAGV